jgi:hypothetical protein
LLETLKVVSDRHGERQQFFERLAGLLKFDGDPSGFQSHSRGQIFELLGDDINRRLHEKLRSFQPFLSEARQHFGDFPAPPHFELKLLAAGERAQVGDQVVAIGQAVGTYAVADAGRQDLLGTPPAHTEEEFDGCAIDKRAGQSLEFPNYAVDLVDPGWFGRHG